MPRPRPTAASSHSLRVRLAGALLAMLVPTLMLGIVGIVVLVKSNQAAGDLHAEVVNEARVMSELGGQLRATALDVERALLRHNPTGPTRFAEASRRVDELFADIENFDEEAEKQAGFGGPGGVGASTLHGRSAAQQTSE